MYHIDSCVYCSIERLLRNPLKSEKCDLEKQVFTKHQKLLQQIQYLM